MPNAAPGPRPKESLFYSPTVYLIGRLTGFKPYVGVDHKLVRDDALRLAGLTLHDPDEVGHPTHASDGVSMWPLNSSSSKDRDGLYRVAHFGWYHQTRQYRPEAEALCAKPVVGKRGQWALTALGVREAKRLREEFEGKITLSAGPNQTALYLGKHFDKLYGRATLHIRRKMPRSEMFDKVDDHVMNWIDRVIQRDGLRSRIEQGRPIAPSQVCAWARRGAYTDIRNEGREAVARVFHGALTPKEVKARAEVNWTEEIIPRTINESEILAHHQYAAHSEDDFVSDTVECLMDEHETAAVEETVADKDAFEYALERLSEIIHDEIAVEHDPDWHEQLVKDRFVKEMSVREIAAAHGLSYEDDQNRIKVALNRVRDVMLRARDEGELDDLILHR
jgi:hypothetical protein